MLDLLKIIDKEIKKGLKRTVFNGIVDDLFDFSDGISDILNILVGKHHNIRILWGDSEKTYAGCSIIFHKNLGVTFFEIEITEDGIMFINVEDSHEEMLQLLNMKYDNNIPTELINNLEKIAFGLV